MTRESLEACQIYIYAAALLAGAAAGLLLPESAGLLEKLISPCLAVLLYTMFAQIPFLQLRQSIANLRFAAALFTANFVAIPVFVWLLTIIFPQAPPILAGVYLVLLTPCIDYVIFFTQLGRGNERLMLMVTPLLFTAQLLLLPIYMWLFLGGEKLASIVQIAPFVEAFAGIIMIPLILAMMTQWWAEKQLLGKRVLELGGWLPVPLMAAVLAIVVASQIDRVLSEWGTIIGVLPIYFCFHLFVPLVAKMLAGWFRLETREGRTLIFSSGTRNSLVVLPLALALPGAWGALAAAVVVTQTLVELLAELVYIRAVPGVLLKDREK
ncbi:arsenic resistance protein [Paenibacillus senegalensis]|uniref:arsenic resistance protein n=1 Tax=Paenibacillus senegalensis TaxID=1465766 RepID=UPI0002894219|nr:arsenic resistance protein [Paenibacillus senegalensis]